MDLEARIRVYLLQWIKIFINNQSSSAANTLRTKIGMPSLQTYFAAKRGIGSEWTSSHKFYGSAMAIWDQYHGFELLNPKEVQSEIIWQNKRITSGRSPIKNGEWQRAGIKYISDICHRNSGELLKIRLSIPLHWRRLLAEDSTATNTPNAPLSDFEIRVQGQDLANASAIGAKAMYTLINGGTSTVSTASLRCRRTERTFPFPIKKSGRKPVEAL